MSIKVLGRLRFPGLYVSFEQELESADHRLQETVRVQVQDKIFSCVINLKTHPELEFGVDMVLSVSRRTSLWASLSTLHTHDLLKAGRVRSLQRYEGRNHSLNVQKVKTGSNAEGVVASNWRWIGKAMSALKFGYRDVNG